MVRGQSQTETARGKGRGRGRGRGSRGGRLGPKYGSRPGTVIEEALVESPKTGKSKAEAELNELVNTENAEDDVPATRSSPRVKAKQKESEVASPSTSTPEPTRRGQKRSKTPASASEGEVESKKQRGRPSKYDKDDSATETRGDGSMLQSSMAEIQQELLEDDAQKNPPKVNSKSTPLQEDLDVDDAQNTKPQETRKKSKSKSGDKDGADGADDDDRKSANADDASQKAVNRSRSTSSGRKDPDTSTSKKPRSKSTPTTRVRGKKNFPSVSEDEDADSASSSSSDQIVYMVKKKKKSKTARKHSTPLRRSMGEKTDADDFEPEKKKKGKGKKKSKKVVYVSASSDSDSDSSASEEKEPSRRRSSSARAATKPVPKSQLDDSIDLDGWVPTPPDTTQKKQFKKAPAYESAREDYYLDKLKEKAVEDGASTPDKEKQESFLKKLREKSIMSGQKRLDPYSPHNPKTVTPQKSTGGSSKKKTPYKKHTGQTPHRNPSPEWDSDIDESALTVFREDVDVTTYFEENPKIELEMAEMWQAKPVLYDDKVDGFGKRDIKACVQRKMAYRLEIPVRFVETRMRSLRNDFLKYYKNSPRSGDGAPVGKTRRQREVLKMCAFLAPHLRNASGRPIASAGRVGASTPTKVISTPDAGTKRDPQEFADYDYEYNGDEGEKADEPSGSGANGKTYFSGKNFPGATDVVESELSDDADRGNIDNGEASDADAAKGGKGKAGPKANAKNSNAAKEPKQGSSKARRSIDYKNRSDVSYDPSQTISKEEMDDYYSEDAKAKSYTSSQARAARADNRKDMVAAMTEALNKPVPLQKELIDLTKASVSGKAAPAPDDDDDIWWKGLKRQLRRLTEEKKMAFLDYVDGRVRDAITGRWDPTTETD